MSINSVYNSSEPINISNLRSLDSKVVHTSGNENINGIKTFSSAGKDSFKESWLVFPPFGKESD